MHRPDRSKPHVQAGPSMRTPLVFCQKNISGSIKVESSGYCARPSTEANMLIGIPLTSNRSMFVDWRVANVFGVLEIDSG